MAIEHARSFVENFFEDDEFTKEVLKKKGFTRGERRNQEIENEKMVRIASEMGFRFDADEYIEANKAYLNELGGFETMKKLFHIIQVATDLYNETKEED